MVAEWGCLRCWSSLLCERCLQRVRPKRLREPDDVAAPAPQKLMKPKKAKAPPSLRCAHQAESPTAGIAYVAREDPPCPRWCVWALTWNMLRRVDRAGALVEIALHTSPTIVHIEPCRGAAARDAFARTNINACKCVMHVSRVCVCGISEDAHTML